LQTTNLKTQKTKVMKIMKNGGLLSIAVLFSAAAFAQTTPSTPASTTPTPEVKAQMKDLRKDVRAYDNKKAEVKSDINKGDLAAAKTDLAAAKADKQDIKADAKTLKSEGVKHPVKLADKEIKKVDEKIVKTDLKDIKADKKDLKQDVKANDIADAKKDIKDLKADKKDLKQDVRQAKRDGIRHPIRRAK